MSSIVENAMFDFHSSSTHHNCAQAVAWAARLSNEEVEGRFAKAGGGRAPEGLCGAVYAAMEAVGKDKAEKVRAAFKRRLGADTCKALKGELKVPCVECVRVAAEEIIEA